MGIFDDLLKGNKNKTNAEKLLDYFKSHNEVENRDEYIRILTNVINGNVLQSFMPDDDLCRVISEVSAQKKDPDNIMKSMIFYDMMVYDIEDTEQVELFHKFFKLFLKSEYLFNNFSDFEIIYNLFSNKKLVLSLYSYLSNNTPYPENYLPDLKSYIKESRQYYVDEEAFFSSIIKVVENLKKSSVSLLTKERIISEAIREDRNSAGIYDIDESRIISLGGRVNQLVDRINLIDNLSKTLDDKCQRISDEAESKTKEFVQDKTKEFTSLYSDFLKEMKDFILKTQNSRDSIIDEVKENGDYYLKKIQELLDIHPEKEQEIKDSLNNHDTKETYSEVLSSKFSLKDKRDKVRKKMSISKECYHATFDRIMKYVLINKPVMLVGPSGSGKTYTVEQIARLLDLPLYNFGFIADEYASIKGYNDAQGNFVKTPFYDCLKYGGICFYDEADNSEARAFMEINKVVGSSGYNPYLFPNGEIVKPHPNFRIIATANTWGDGADTIHSTREKLDGASLNRFERIYYDYDEKLEQSIMSDYPDVYAFAIAYRKSVYERGLDKIISTRDLSDIKDYLDSGEFFLDEVLEAKFVNGMRRDSLEGIIFDLKKKLVFVSNDTLETFESVVHDRKVKVK